MLSSVLVADKAAAAAAVAALDVTAAGAALPAAEGLRTRRRSVCRTALQSLACWSVQKPQLQVRLGSSVLEYAVVM